MKECNPLAPWLWCCLIRAVAYSGSALKVQSVGKPLESRWSYRIFWQGYIYRQITPPPSLASPPIHVGFVVHKLPLVQFFLGVLGMSRGCVWLHGQRRGSSATRLLGLWGRIPPGAWMFLSCECCVLSGRGLCVGLITHLEESYRVRCVWVWSRNLKDGET